MANTTKVTFDLSGAVVWSLFCVFLTMKLLGVGQVAGWSWWAVTAPLWGPVVAWAILMVVAALLAGFAWLLSR